MLTGSREPSSLHCGSVQAIGMPLRNQRVNAARCGWNSVFHHFIDSVQMVLGRKRSWQKIWGTTLMGVVDWVDRGLFFAASRLRQGWFPFAWELALTKIYWAMDRRHLSFGAVLTDSRYFSICLSHMDCIMSRYMHLRYSRMCPKWPRLSMSGGELFDIYSEQDFWGQAAGVAQWSHWPPG